MKLLRAPARSGGRWARPAESRSASAGRPRSVAKKLAQMSAACELERSWSKEQILEAYLNLAVFRGADFLYYLRMGGGVITSYSIHYTKLYDW